MSHHTLAKIKAALTKETGFEHFLFVQSGSSALELFLRTVRPSEQTIFLPALACWVLAGTVKSLGLRCDFVDIEADLSCKASGVGLNVAVAPWGQASSWTSFACDASACIDLTHGIGATNIGAPPAAYFLFGFASCGRGKPLDIGNGGIAMFRSEDVYTCARRFVERGIVSCSFATAVPFFGLSAELFPLLDKRIAQLNGFRINREKWMHWAMGNQELQALAALPPSTPDASPGASSIVPLVLHRALGLRQLRSLCVSALLEEIPIVQPIHTPIYWELGWDQTEKHHCPKAESLASKLLLIAWRYFTSDHVTKFSKLMRSPGWQEFVSEDCAPERIPIFASDGRKGYYHPLSRSFVSA